MDWKKIGIGTYGGTGWKEVRRGLSKRFSLFISQGTNMPKNPKEGDEEKFQGK